MAAADLAPPTRHEHRIAVIMEEFSKSITKINEEHFSKMRTIISENQKQLNKLFERCFAIVDDGARDAHPHFSAPEQSDNADHDDDFNCDDADVLSGLEFVEDENGLNTEIDETEVVYAEPKNSKTPVSALDLFDESPKKNGERYFVWCKISDEQRTVLDCVHDTYKLYLEGNDLVYNSRIVSTFGAFPRVKLKLNVLFEQCFKQCKTQRVAPVLRKGFDELRDPVCDYVHLIFKATFAIIVLKNTCLCMGSTDKNSYGAYTYEALEREPYWPSEKLRISITGAGGFIASHIARRLKSEGHYIIASDWKKNEHMPEDMFCHEFHLVDLRVMKNCLKVSQNVDHVFNLAADIGGMGFIQSNHSVIMYNNTMISFNMLEAGRISGVKRLFYASSACIYPEFKQLETNVSLKESDAWPAEPQDAYGLEKLATEELCKHYTKDFGIVATQERDALYLRGLLPPVVLSQDLQVKKLMHCIRQYEVPLQRYMAMLDFQERNERLFYKLLIGNVEELLPVVYTPTVGDACEKYGSILRRPQGLFISLKEKGRILEVLNNWPEKNIQGTASVVLAGIMAALKLVNGSLAEQKFLFIGAGEAGTGIAELIALEMSTQTGMPLEEARKYIWLVYSKGLVVSSRFETLQHFKKPWAHEHEPIGNFLDVVKAIKPTVLIGSSGVGRTFTKDVVQAMASFNMKPVIFVLSNPTSRSECTAEEAYAWSKGRAIYASGSPFAPVEFNGKIYVSGQANNAYIFPGLGLTISGAIRVHDDMLLAASEALAVSNDIPRGRV